MTERRLLVFTLHDECFSRGQPRWSSAAFGNFRILVHSTALLSAFLSAVPFMQLCEFPDDHGKPAGLSWSIGQRKSERKMAEALTSEPSLLLD